MPIIPPQSCTTSVSPPSSSRWSSSASRSAHPAFQGVLIPRVVGLVREPAADVVGDDRPVRGAQRFDEPPVVERPGRVAVDHHDRLPLALVEVVVAEPVDLEVAPGMGLQERVEAQCCSSDHPPTPSPFTTRGRASGSSGRCRSRGRRRGRRAGGNRGPRPARRSAGARRCRCCRGRDRWKNPSPRRSRAS